MIDLKIYNEEIAVCIHAHKQSYLQFPVIKEGLDSEYRGMSLISREGLDSEFRDMSLH